MPRIVVGGQLQKNKIRDLILELSPKIKVEIKSDLDAAMAILNKQADYYLGACDTGGGGALAMAIGLLGIDKAKTIATVSSRKSDEEVKDMILNGVVAFGFVQSQVEWAVKTIFKYLEVSK